jgi:hypothetical protein
MVRYSIKQKKAVISLVFAAMIVDNKEINDQRTAYLQVVADLMQVYNDMFEDAMNNMSHEESIAILNEMPPREKARVAIILFQMFTADGGPIVERHKLFFNNIDRGAHIKDALRSTGLIHWVSAINQLI